MSRVSVSPIFSLLGRDARAFLAEGLDRRLVLVVLLGRFLGRGPAAVAAGRERLAAAVAGIVGHRIVLVLGLVGFGIVMALAHFASLEGSEGKPAARRTG